MNKTTKDFDDVDEDHFELNGGMTTVSETLGRLALAAQAVEEDGRWSALWSKDLTLDVADMADRGEAVITGNEHDHAVVVLTPAGRKLLPR